MAELAGADAPELVLVNDEDLTYCKTRFDDTSLATLRAALGDLTDPLARALCWSALWNMTRDALLPARDFIDLVLRFAGRETDIGVLQMLHAWAESAAVDYTAPELAQGGRVRLAQGAAEQLRAAGEGSEQQLAWARFFARVACAPGDFALLGSLLDGTETLPGLEVDQELRWAFLEPLAAHGAADEKRLDEELARDDTASGRRHHVRCLAARPSAAVKAQCWAQVVESGRAVQRAGGRRRSRASPRRPSGSCSRRTRRSTSRRSSGCGRSGRSRSGWTWCAGCSRRTRTPRGPWTRPTRGLPRMRGRRLRCGGWCSRRAMISLARCGGRRVTPRRAESGERGGLLDGRGRPARDPAPRTPEGLGCGYRRKGWGCGYRRRGGWSVRG
ncbi:hypothetical protein SALBM217S_10404 [Streptomyces griseoloalbus]